MNLVFDFGAVLFSWQPGLLVKQHFPQQAASAEQAAMLARALFGHADWHEFDRGRVSVHEVSARSAARLGLDTAAMTTMVQAIAEHLQPVPAMVDLLAGLHASRSRRLHPSAPDLRLYFLSNMPQPYARALQARHDFLQWFDGGIFSGDVHHIKPEPAIYDLLQTRYALVPAQTVFVDDLPTNVQAAQALGWHGIHFESAAQLQAQLDLLAAAAGNAG